MSDNEQRRQPKGVPVGGRFAGTTRGEPSLTLDAGPADQRAAQAAALTDLADTLIGGQEIVPDDLEAAALIVPHVPAHLLSDQLWHDVLVATLQRDETGRAAAVDALVALDAREARWQNDPTFVCPTGYATETGGEGPVHYTTTTGSRFTGWRDVVSVAKDVRADLKDAVRAGYLPEGLKFGVTTSKFSMGQALRVSVRGLHDDAIYANDPVSLSPGRMYSKATVEIMSRVEALAGAYDRETTEAQTDFHRGTYFTSVDIEDEHRAQARVAESAARAGSKVAAA
jgi:hypothetical protein